MRTQDVAAVEHVDSCLDRIERLDGRLHAFVTVTPEQARAAAAATAHAPLHGLVVALKDNIDVAGVRTASGSRFFAEHVPERDAPVWARLRAAGAALAGKTNLHEFAYGATTQNPHWGECRNPWALDRIPGGSSGGSGAAVAAGMCDVALGTDTGGSVRIPASLCGVSGLRPTFGRVPNRGIFPVAASYDTCGPLARSVADVARAFRVAAGYDDEDPTSRDGEAASALPVGRLRIGVPTAFFFDDVEPDVERAVRAVADALAALGARLVELELPGAAEVVAANAPVVLAEALSVHADRLDGQPELFGDDVRRRLELGRSVTGVEYALGVEERRRWRRTVARAWERVDVVLSPATAIVAPSAEGETLATTRELTRLTWPWSIAGGPALSVPCGFSGDGLPIVLQLAAAPWHEEIVLALGEAYQQVTDWHLREPPLS
jgi:aspartyl-tRNA(Asn)/glutamyl-tRNA(Gln) amidotransferase subunit A